MKNRSTSVLMMLGMLIAISPFSIDMYLPAFPDIASSLNTNVAKVGYSLSSYYAGLCIGQLIYGIGIDRFGRKKPLIVGMLIYVVAAVSCALSGSLQQLIAVRLFMALGGCVGMVAARAMVRDLYPPQEMPKILSLLVLVMGIAPVIAPTLGGLVNSLFGWRWVFGTMALIGVLAVAGTQFILPETQAANPEVSTKLKTIISGYLEVLRNRTFLIYTLVGGISYAGMYAYIAGSPFVFMQKFGFTDSAFGWAFALNACGLIAGSQLNHIALKRYSSPSIVRFTSLCLVLTTLCLVLLTLFGIAGPVTTLGFIFLFLFWVGFINPNATALALAPFTASAGRASALLGSIQMVAGVMASWLVSYFNNGTLLTMPLVMFGCCLVSFVLHKLIRVSGK